MAYPNGPYPASYKRYNGSEWVEYYLRTSADLVGETGPYNGDQSYARKFVTSNVYVNGVAFAFTNLPTQGATAEVTITGANIRGAAASQTSGYTLQYISASDYIDVALGKLDRAAYLAAQSAQGYLPLTGGTITGSLTVNNALSAGGGITASLGNITASSGSVISNSGYVVANSSVPNIYIKFNGAAIYHRGALDSAEITNYLPSEDGTLATQSWVTSQINALPTPMQFKGTVGSGGTVEWAALQEPSAANEGWTYKVISAAPGQLANTIKVGDTIISNGTTWVVIPSGDEPGGTVTNIATGTGLTGGPITSTGTISIDTSWLNTVLASYVPYTGASGNVNIGNNSYQFSDANSSAYLIGGARKTVDNTANQSVMIFDNPRGLFGFFGEDGYGIFDTNSLTDNRKYVLPDANGTLATQEWANNTFTKTYAQSAQPSSAKAGDIWIDTSN